MSKLTVVLLIALCAVWDVAAHLEEDQPYGGHGGGGGDVQYDYRMDNNGPPRFRASSGGLQMEFSGNLKVFGPGGYPRGSGGSYGPGGYPPGSGPYRNLRDSKLYNSLVDIEDCEEE